MMLLVQLDAMVPLITGPGSIDASTQWLIMPHAEPVPSGFVEQRVVGDLQLLAREP